MSNFSAFDAYSLVVGTEKMYRLDVDLVWEIGAKGSGWVLNVPKGTEFDISVPHWLEWAQGPHDRRVLLAAAIHDELLRLGHDVAFASAEFRRAAIALGCSSRRGWSLFFATLGYTAFTHKG